MALVASASAPRDGEIHALIGDIYERLRRFAQAANSYRNYINLLPNKDRSEKAAWARAQVDFLDSFGDSSPVDIDEQDLNMLHTIPFTLVKDKIIVQARVNGGRLQDFVLDTGSEETVLSRETASRERIRPVTYTLSAGVGEVGLRGLQLAKLKELEVGTLQVRNRADPDQEPGPSRDSQARGRVVLAALAGHVDDDRLPEAAADDWPQAAAGQGRHQPADARPSAGHGARHAELDASHLLRGGHRR